MGYDKLKLVLFASLIYMSQISLVAAQDSHTTYLVFVDNDLGFYKVRDITNPTHSFDYTDHTLIINQGDTIIWQNDADRTTFTILSQQNLWDEIVGNLRPGSKINYQFENPGLFTIYIKEYPTAKQTVIVNTAGGITTKTPIPSETATPIATTSPSPKATTSPSPIIKPTPIIKPIIKPTVTITPNINNTSNQTTGNHLANDSRLNINIPIKFSATTIASFIVAIFSMIITYIVRGK
jgi:hypothetical protein